MPANARRPALFDDPHFRRNGDLPDQNKHINYGYAVSLTIIFAGKTKTLILLEL